MKSHLRKLTVFELIEAFGTTPTADRGIESHEDLLRRRKQHIARLNTPKRSKTRAFRRFTKNSTAIVNGYQT